MASLRIYMISNMYPSLECPNFGVFVRNFELDFPTENIVLSDKTVIKGKRSGINLMIAYFLFFLEIIKKLYRGDFDAVYVHYLQHSLIPFHFWRNTSTKKVILNAHGTDILGKGKLYQALRRWNQSIIQHADLIVVPSTFFFHKLTQLGVKSDKITVYPSGGINPDLFFPGGEKTSPSLKIGYLGRIDRGKGVETLVRAMADPDLVHVSLEICGPGSMKNEMEELSQILGISGRISFLGNIPQERIRDFFLKWDALVFPSELEESLGLVGLEAMACGLPVIGSGSGGMSSYLNSGENGIVFEPGDVSDLVRKICEFYSQDQNYRNQLAINAIVTADRYHSQRVNEALRNQIRTIFAS